MSCAIACAHQLRTPISPRYAAFTPSAAPRWPPKASPTPSSLASVASPPARALDLELGHEDHRVFLRALRVDDRPLVREVPEAGEVVNVRRVEQDVTAQPRTADMLEQALAPRGELLRRDSPRRPGPLRRGLEVRHGSILKPRRTR